MSFSYFIKFTNLILMYIMQDTALLLATKVLVNEQLILSPALVNNLPTTVPTKKNIWTCGIVLLFLAYNMEP